jgi:hypothetical protein
LPFTVSHAAAALPLHAWSKGRLPLAALVIGSMSPDFTFFLLPLGPARGATHDIAGLFWFCLPTGLAVWWVFVRLLERPTLALVPESWRAGLAPPTHRISFSLLVRAGGAVLLGAVTHVIWDGFTHPGTPIVKALPVLDTYLRIGAVSMPLYDVLQLLSSAFGLAVLGIWVLRLRRPRPYTAQANSQALPAVSNGMRLSAVAALLLASCLFSMLYYATDWDRPVGNRLFYLLIGAMTGWALAWCGIAAWLQMRWSSLRS